MNEQLRKINKTHRTDYKGFRNEWCIKDIANMI